MEDNRGRRHQTGDSAPLPVVDTVLVAGKNRTLYSDFRMVYVNGLQAIIKALPRETGRSMTPSWQRNNHLWHPRLVVFLRLV